MTSVKTYPETPATRPARARLERALGFLPATYAAMSRSGPFLESMLALEAAAGSNLDPKTRQLISIAVSAANGCSYCLEAHRALALLAGASEEEVTGTLEVAALMSAYNTFNKAIRLPHDVTPATLGVSVGDDAQG